MAKPEKHEAVQSFGQYRQAITAANTTPNWSGYWGNMGATGSPNLMWQGTSSGATYCSASSVLKP